MYLDESEVEMLEEINPVIKKGIKIYAFTYQISCLREEGLYLGGGDTILNAIQSMRLTKKVTLNRNFTVYTNVFT